MLTLGKLASKKYLELNRMYAREIAEGKRDTKLADLLNAIHDMYKVIQLYPNLGKELSVKENQRIIDIIDGWKMIYSSVSDMIEVVDFVKEGEDLL